MDHFIIGIPNCFQQLCGVFVLVHVLSVFEFHFTASLVNLRLILWHHRFLVHNLSFFAFSFTGTGCRSTTFGRGKKVVDNKDTTKRAQGKRAQSKKGTEQKGCRAKRVQNKKGAEQKGRRTKRAQNKKGAEQKGREITMCFAKTKSQIKFKNAFSWLRLLWLCHIGIWSSQDMNPDVFMTFALAKKYHFQFQLFIFISSKQITTQFLLSGAIVCHRTCVLHST